MQLLEAVRVLDLSNVLAGPFCSQLAPLGADVIGIDVCGCGDLARQLAPIRARRFERRERFEPVERPDGSLKPI